MLARAAPAGPWRGYTRPVRFLTFTAKTLGQWACALLAAASLNALAAARQSDVAIGVFAYQGERAAISDWSPVIDYLNKSLPAQRFHLHNYDAGALRQAIAEHKIDLVITNPGYYVAMESEFGLSRIATLVSPHVARNSQAIGSVVLTRADRQDLHSLADLAGQRVAAVSAEAFAGYLVAAREMRRVGVDPESDLQETQFLGLPMTAIIAAVRSGQADAGIVRACLPEQLASRGEFTFADFRILSPRQAPGFDCALSTPLYPDWPIAVTRQTDPALAKAVARALLSMPEGAGNITWSVPADYQPVHDLYRELRLGPYAYLREITPEGLARRFWPWLAGLLVMLVAWLIHTVRVEQLVHRRSAELRESLQARETAEKRARDHQEQMEHLSRLSILGELSGSLAHEINQPLTSIGTYARSVLRRQAAGNLTPAAISEACGEIAAEAERAGGIVQRIRHFAKKRTAARDLADLAEVCDEARRLVVGMLVTAPHITIERQAAVDCRVLADGPQIQQVLLNLIKNAIDAARDLPAARQDIRIVIEQAEHRLVTHVIDRGTGLDAAQREHLFEAFFTTKANGLGLGLPICKSIIEAHGGRLWAEPNADGIGMCFSFSLPRHELHA